MNFESILTQVFQPYFYYSMIFLVISFVCIKVLARYTNFMGQRTKSLLYLVPLAIPLIVMLIFIPSTVIQSNGPLLRTATGPITSATTGGVFRGFSSNLPVPPLPPPNLSIVTAPITAAIFSITGILCIIGLAAGGFFALSMLAADDRVARKVLHVISLSPHEHPWLQIKVAELSSKLAIVAPKVGFVEDLRPNAFTIGYGENTTIVFSLGLLNVLDHDEIAAVAAHELAHVKNHDFFYKTITSALTVVSFFNPLAYIVSSAGQREREMYADERAIELAEKPAALGNALAKICKVIQSLPKESFIVSFSSNLLVTSSVLPKLGILSTHPRLDKRLRNISEPRSAVQLSHRRVGLVVFLSMLLVCSAIAVSFAVVNIQTGYAASHQIKAPSPDFKTTGYLVGSGGVGSSGMATGNLSVPVIMNMPMHQAVPGMSNNTVFVVVNNGTVVNSQIGPMTNFFVVRPQSFSFSP